MWPAAVFLVLLEVRLGLVTSQPIPPEGHLQPLGLSGLVIPVSHVEGDLAATLFLREYIRPQRPILMRSAARSWPAFHLWSDSYLTEKTSREAPLMTFTVEMNKKENRSSAIFDETLVEFLATYNYSDKYLVNEVPAFLKPDLLLPFALQCRDLYEHLDTAVMWFSSGGTKSVLHYDNYENVNCLLRGSKRLLLMDPKQFSAEAIAKLLDTPRTSASLLDVDRVDLERYPALRGVTFYEMRMEAGDCAYLPTGWLHQVTSEGSNLAVNLWWNKMGIDIAESSCHREFQTNMTLTHARFIYKDYRSDLKQFWRARLKPWVKNLQSFDVHSRDELVSIWWAHLVTTQPSVNESKMEIFSNTVLVWSNVVLPSTCTFPMKGGEVEQHVRLAYGLEEDISGHIIDYYYIFQLTQQINSILFQVLGQGDGNKIIIDSKTNAGHVEL